MTSFFPSGRSAAKRSSASAVDGAGRIFPAGCSPGGRRCLEGGAGGVLELWDIEKVLKSL